jgi:predicted metal-binding protein
MKGKRNLEALFEKHGVSDFKWIDPKTIVVAQWVRMKCFYGCSGYGTNATCPPEAPSVAECRSFFAEYKTAALFHFGKAVRKPEDRHRWSKGINQRLLKLEREVFLSGFQKAFLLPMDSCELCRECPGTRAECIHPRLARPTPEALAVDVYATVRANGYPLAVLPDYSATMNRYAFLLVE